ncbi:hypothetical protein [[Eubacterium] hominis]|uniref:hypothetical protein n=1 Tax=[Eubacterium] hominis TaxID=2764325 RepID=UPI003A4E58FD
MSQSTNEKCIYILLTKFTDTASKAIRGLTRSTYTHASIGVDDQHEEFYSFVTNGFRKEQFHRFSKHRRVETACRLYKIHVSDELYDEICIILKRHEACAPYYKYSKLGVALCLLHIGHKIRHRYFCSQFVAEILQTSEIIQTKKSSSLYLPDDFMNMRELDLCYCGNLDGMLQLAY